MLKWILNNKEWLFSGVGIFIIAGLYGFLKSKTNFKLAAHTNTNANLKADPDLNLESENLTNPISVTAKYIRKQINLLPPFQQKDAIKHYIGLTIDWEMNFHTAEQNDGDIAHVTLVIDKEGRPDFASCDVKLSQYPELKVMQEGKKIRVKAKIKSINSGLYWFQLKDAILVY